MSSPKNRADFSAIDAPSVRRNLATLREDGFIVMHPSLGYEVAVAPSERTLAYGAAPTVQSVALVTEAVLSERAIRERVVAVAG